MLLTISTTHRPATDLGYLLHKNPARIQTFPLSYGQAHVYYPEAGADRCTAALQVELDPIALVRGKGPEAEGFALQQYVNDRPYAASSFLSVAIAQVFGSALSGRSAERPDLVDTHLPLEVHLAALPSRGGEEVIQRLFGPLGYDVQVEPGALPEAYPDWGRNLYFNLTLRGTVRLRDLLSHLYVLVPALDEDKHYWVGEDELEKLLRHGGDWLPAHPERALITHRYLRRQRALTRAALARLSEDDPDADDLEEAHTRAEASVEERISLHQQRHGAVLGVVRGAGAASVLDLGCGEGKLLELLIKERSLTRIVGMDVSHRSLARAAQHLHLDRLADSARARIQLLHGSLLYRDRRLEGFDVATVVEVIEHLDAARLAAFERVVFQFARPRTVVITTPNVEYNVRWESLPAGEFRHRDHRFEWTRAQFTTWSEDVAGRFGYAVRFSPIGPEDARLGAPSQMAVFHA